MPQKLSDNEENQAFCNWLVCWIVLPNLPFLPITLSGGPIRMREILVGGIVGLIVRKMGYPIRLTAFLLLLLYFTLSYITAMFNMHISMLTSVAHLVLELNPAVSPEYMIGLTIYLAIIGFSLFLFKKGQNFQSLKAVIACCLLVLVASFSDFLWAYSNATSYSRVADADEPFSSATQQVDLLSYADGKTNILVILVESMGVPNDARMAKRLNDIWDRPEFAERYDISDGTTTFFNSTTKAEIRELCRRWGDYPDIQSKDVKCLPAQLAQRGYESTAYHGFSSSFFDRERWYPLIGLNRLFFREELSQKGASHCENVFAGSCDRDIPKIIAADFRQHRGAQFAYWLTLNSHLPIVANESLGTLGCQQLGPELDQSYPQICRLFSLWDDVATALAAEVAKPDFPPTHILIVGDHMPPFSHQKSRLQFDSTRTPWIFLRYRR